MYTMVVQVMVIIIQLTQVRKEKNGKINFLPGIEPSTQRLEVQYTKHQAITQDKSLSPHSFPMYCQWSLANLPTSHWQTPQILCRQNPFRGQLEHLPIRGGAKMGGFTVQILVGNLSPPGDGMVIITQLTQVSVLPV